MIYSYDPLGSRSYVCMYVCVCLYKHTSISAAKHTWHRIHICILYNHIFLHSSKDKRSIFICICICGRMDIFFSPTRETIEECVIPQSIIFSHFFIHPLKGTETEQKNQLMIPFCHVCTGLATFMLLNLIQKSVFSPLISFEQNFLDILSFKLLASKGAFSHLYINNHYCATREMPLKYYNRRASVKMHSAHIRALPENVATAHFSS